MTLGIELATELLVVGATDAVEVSMNDGLAVVTGLVELGPQAELDVHPANPRTMAAHAAARQRKSGPLT